MTAVRLFGLVLAAVSLIAAGPVDHTWSHYRFARFGTGADVPTDLFTGRSVPDNSDGATFTASDGAKLLVFGSWNVEDRTAAGQAEWLIGIDPKRYAALSYRKIGRTTAVLSGTQGNTIYYERYRFDDPSGAIHAVVLEYPASRRAVYDPLVKRISASLDWTKPL